MDKRTHRIRRLERALYLAMSHIGNALTYQHDQCTADFANDVRAEFPDLFDRVHASNMPPPVRKPGRPTKALAQEAGNRATGDAEDTEA